MAKSYKESDGVGESDSKAEKGGGTGEGSGGKSGKVMKGKSGKGGKGGKGLKKSDTKKSKATRLFAKRHSGLTAAIDSGSNGESRGGILGLDDDLFG